MPHKSKTIYLEKHKGRRRKKTLKPRAVIALLLMLAAVSGVTVALLPNVYQVSVDGEVLGNIASKAILEETMTTIRLELQTQYKSTVQVLDSATLKKVHGKKNEVITPNYLASELRKRLDFEVEFKEVRVDGETLGIIADEAILEDLMAKLKRKYLRGYEGEIAFNKEIELVPVFAKEEALSELDELYQACIKKNTEEFDYTVASGDTLWAIANKHDITVPRLLQANEGMTETTPLKVGQTLNIKREVPVLKVVEVAVVSN